MEAVAKKVNNENSQDAFALASVAVARVKLDSQDFAGARKDLDLAEKILDTFDSVETVVHAAFYETNADYFNVCLFWRPIDFPTDNVINRLRWTSRRTTRTLSST